MGVRPAEEGAALENQLVYIIAMDAADHRVSRLFVRCLTCFGCYQRATFRSPQISRPFFVSVHNIFVIIRLSQVSLVNWFPPFMTLITDF